MTARRALVLGGSGHVGAAVVDVLTKRGVPCHFTWHAGEQRARELADRTGARATRLDLRDAEAVRGFAATRNDADLIIHAASHPDWRSIDDVDLKGWDDVFAVTIRGPFSLIQAWAPRLRASGADLVFVTGMAPLRSVAAPPQAAAAQGALAGLARSLTRALAPRVRANVVALGTLDGGTATRIDAQFTADQCRFSAQRRVGTAAEVAETIAWVGLSNTYLSGAIIPVAGGL